MKNKFEISFALLILSFAVICLGDSTSLFLNATAKYDSRVTIGRGDARLIGEFGNQISFVTGTATDAEELNANYFVSTTVTSSSSDIYDLQNLSDFQGASLSFKLVKFFGVRNISSAARMTVGGDSWLKTTTLDINGIRMDISPMTGLSVATGASSITISTASDSAQYEILISGIKN